MLSLILTPEAADRTGLTSLVRGVLVGDRFQRSGTILSVSTRFDYVSGSLNSNFEIAGSSETGLLKTLCVDALLQCLQKWQCILKDTVLTILMSVGAWH